MKKTAIYPGTFDPITFGHIDVIRKSLKIVDTVSHMTVCNTLKKMNFNLTEVNTGKSQQ